MSTDSPRSTDSPTIDLRLVVLIIALSAPLALGVETLLRTQVLARILGPELDELREFFSPQTTKVAWLMVGVTGLAGVIGMIVTRLALRPLAREPDPAVRAGKLRDRLLLLTSIPQVPAIVATLCFMAGSRLLPVMVAMAVSTAFVLIQGFSGERMVGRA
ncbi:hypothetical protein ACNOYE_12540 [Nannocystaceae bacterium ST9]